MTQSKRTWPKRRVVSLPSGAPTSGYRYDADVENIDLGPYLQAVCADAMSGGPHCKLEFNAAPGIELDPDRAISLALIVNELVTNAVKHGLSGRGDGQISV